MQPKLNDMGTLYVLGACPTRSSDRAGEAFADRLGQVLRKEVGTHAIYDYVCRTLPPVDKKTGLSREPKRTEILAFTDDVENSIAEARPNVVLAVGKTAANWATRGTDQIMTLAGHWFRRKFGDHETWVMCVNDPVKLSSMGDKRYYKVDVSEHLLYWKKHVREANAESWEPQRDRPRCDDPARALDGVEVLRDFSDVIEAIRSMQDAKFGAFDYETWRLRPYYADSRILSIGLDDGNRCVSFVIDHEMHPWTAKQRASIKKELRKMFRSGTWAAHKLQFDIEWSMELLGEDCVNWDYECSMLMAWALDPGGPGDKGPLHLSLDFQCAKEFGVRIKQLTSAAGNRADLRGVAVDELLRYNAVDARYHRRLFLRLEEQSYEKDCRETYGYRIGRVAALSRAQRRGIPVSQQRNKEAKQRVAGEREEVLLKLRDTDGVRQFEERFNEDYNPDDDEHKTLLFRDILGLESGIKEDGSYSLDKKLILNEGDGLDSVKLSVRISELSKLASTYIGRMDIEHPQTLVYPDGKVHAQFSTSRARSGRLSIDSPSLQNWPSRTDNWIRNQLKAPPGFTYLHGDFGQVEARLLAMESQDPTWIRMIVEDYDVHLEWAEKIASASNHTFRKYGKSDIQTLRKFIKNALVFPLFFGSSVGAVANSCEMERPLMEPIVEEFWDTFMGIKVWQHQKWEEYQETGKVMTLTGTARYGPLSFNQVCNHPSQGAASDITVEGMCELERRSREQEKPWLLALLQIHDALITLVPNEELEDAAVQMVESVFTYRKPWMEGVPLSFDVEYGPDLANLTTIGSFRNDQI